MKEETLQALNLFIEKANYLYTLGYLKNPETITSMKLKKQEDGTFEFEYKGPSKEERDALLLTFRLFIQDRDGISIRSLERLYDDPGLSDKWKELHSQIRAALDIALSRVVIESPEVGKLMLRDVLKIGLYGYLGHLNEDKLKTYKTLVYDETSEMLFEDTFNEAVIKTLWAIENISRISKEELSRSQA